MFLNMRSSYWQSASGQVWRKVEFARQGWLALIRYMKPEKVKFMLMAADMKRAVAFYRDVIGLEEVFVSDFWTELRHGDAIVALHGGHDGSRNPTGLSFQYEDVLAMADQITGAGAKILQSPEQRAGEPILLGIFRDAEGNEVFITQYVG